MEKSLDKMTIFLISIECHFRNGRSVSMLFVQAQTWHMGDVHLCAVRSKN